MDLSIFATPEAWISLVTLIFLEIILGVDNIVFITITTDRLKESQQHIGRKLGLAGALLMRIIFLCFASYLVHMTTALFTIDLGIYRHGFAVRDLVLLLGGIYLLYKGIEELTSVVKVTDLREEHDAKHSKDTSKGRIIGLPQAIATIMVMDVVFSIDSVITAVGLADHLIIMIIAVITAVLLMMVFNVINAIKAGELKEAIFDHNGICGFIFYGSVVACVMLFMTGHALPGTVVLVIMFVIPLILIALKEPIMAIVFKKTEAMPKQAGIFAVQAFFEMFEVLLSYFSNTLSFVRIGGFAVSHASMMGVVMMLAGAENGGMGNLIVVILGNLFVCGLEGLIVGIQVMRLEYYEMFSRFYRGGGREFKPYRES